jgi:hypothetical protein
MGHGSTNQCLVAEVTNDELREFLRDHARAHRRQRRLERGILLATWVLLFVAVGAAILTIYGGSWS